MNDLLVHKVCNHLQTRLNNILVVAFKSFLELTEYSMNDKLDIFRQLCVHRRQQSCINMRESRTRILCLHDRFGKQTLATQKILIEELHNDI